MWLVTTTSASNFLLSVLHRIGRVLVPTASMNSWVDAQTPASAYWRISTALASPSFFIPNRMWALVTMRF